MHALTLFDFKLFIDFRFLLQTLIVTSLEGFFDWYGKSVCQKPWTYIFLCILATGICAVGLLKFHRENTGVKLWIPENSDFRINSDWLWDNHPPSMRFSTMIFVAENVLNADIIRTMYGIRKQISLIRTSYNETWNDVCQKAPIMRRPDISTLMEVFGKKRRKRFSDDDENLFEGKVYIASLSNLLSD